MAIKSRFGTAAVCVAVAIIAVGAASSTASALTLEQRLQGVEKKTDYYRVKRVTKRKAWTQLNSSTTNRADVASVREWFDVPTGTANPVLANVWITFTADYSASTAFIVGSNGYYSRGDIPQANTNSANKICGLSSAPNSAGSGTVSLKLFCHGVVNAPDQVFRVFIYATPTGPGDLPILSNAELTVHMVNQEIIEPAE
jgi:hypothetical protein